MDLASQNYFSEVSDRGKKTLTTLFGGGIAGGDHLSANLKKGN